MRRLHKVRSHVPTHSEHFSVAPINWPLVTGLGMSLLMLLAYAAQGARSDLANGYEVGLYDQNWKALLDTYTSNEELEVKLNLPRAEFMKLKFSDIVSIAGVRMYIRKIRHRLPYNGTVQLECVRI